MSSKKVLQAQRTLFFGFSKRGFQTILVDGSDYRSSYFKRDPLTGGRHIKTLRPQVGDKLTLGFIISVRYVITHAGSFSGNLTNSSHDLSILQMRVQI